FRAAVGIFTQCVAHDAGVETRVRRQRGDALRGVHPLIEREPPACRLGERLALGPAQGRETSGTPGKACRGANLFGERAAQRRRRCGGAEGAPAPRRGGLRKILTPTPPRPKTRAAPASRHNKANKLSALTGL